MVEPTEENRLKLDSLVQSGSVNISMLSQTTAQLLVDNKPLQADMFTSTVAEVKMFG